MPSLQSALSKTIAIRAAIIATGGDNRSTPFAAFFPDDGLNVRLRRGSGRSLDLPAPAEKPHGAQTGAEQQQRRRKGSRRSFRYLRS
jgi:hypothetical protein